MTTSRIADPPYADEPGPPPSPGGWDERSDALLGTASVDGTGANGGAAADNGTAADIGPGAGFGSGADVDSGAGFSSGGGPSAGGAGRAPHRGPRAGARAGAASWGRSATPPRQSAGAGAAAGRSAPRRGPVDPVKTLLHRHRGLCERAVDPLEIAAGLEAHGVTDRTAARFRHRDVFALAEELYARVPRDDEPPRPSGPAPAPPPGAPWALLPAGLAALTGAGWRLLDGTPRTVVALLGALAVAAAVLLCLRHGPLRARGRAARTTAVWAPLLLGCVGYGTGLLDEFAAGGPFDVPPFTPAPLVGLALAVAPAAWCVRLFSVRARRRLGVSRALGAFASGVRPLLFGVVALYAAALAAAVAVAAVTVGEGEVDGGVLAATCALGLLLFVARLLSAHGFARAAAVGLGAACAGHALGPVLLAVGRLPGCDALARPVEAALTAWGAGTASALVCGVAAAGLLVRAAGALSRASAHAS
ncbi:hypothetical protein [Streptomyces sp. NPDC047315]|uniref:hypothetical protein n=1 Tax=Streptomyces sp. NPDC047315 TaxID=3155142 RepID=UPI0033F9C409